MFMRANEENLALLALATRPKFSWASTRLRIEQLGSPTAVLDEAYDGQLLNADRDAELARAESRISELLRQGIHVATVVDDDYPAGLRGVHDAPPVLYWQGQHDVRDRNSVAIVGTRRPTEPGAVFARQLARLLAEADTPVVSGLARGIDTEAMRSSLETGGRTVGVIGTGHGVYYPREPRPAGSGGSRPSTTFAVRTRIPSHETDVPDEERRHVRVLVRHCHRGGRRDIRNTDSGSRGHQAWSAADPS